MRRTVGAWLIVLLATTVAAAQSPESGYTRGLVAYQNGEYPQAIAAFTGVLDAQPGNTGALYYRGLAKAKTGDHDGAIADLEAAHGADPALPVTASLGFIHYERGHRAEAKAWLQRVGADDAAAGRAQLLLGVIAAEEGELAEAGRHLDEAQRLDQSLAAAVAYQRGVVLEKEGAPAAVEEGAPCPPRRRFSLYASGGFEYDSNLLLQDDPPGSSSTSSPASPALVDLDKSDGRFVFGAGANVHLLQQPMVRIDIGYDFHQSAHFRVKELNLQGHRLHTQMEFLDGPIIPGIDGGYSFYLLDDRTYFQELAGSPYLLWDEAGQGQLEIYYRIRGRDYLGAPFNPGRDGVNHAAGVRQAFFLGAPGQVLDFWYQYDREDPKAEELAGNDNEFERQTNTVGVGLSWPFPDIAMVALRYWYRNDDYLNGSSRGLSFRCGDDNICAPGEPRSTSSTDRRDDVHTFEVAVSRQLTDWMYAQVAYLGQIDDSNIGTFEYDRHIVSATVGVTY